MIEFNSYVHDPLAPRIFVNNFGALGAAGLTLPYSNATASLSVVG
jgi:hypothetical protein